MIKSNSSSSSRSPTDNNEVSTLSISNLTLVGFSYSGVINISGPLNIVLANITLQSISSTNGAIIIRQLNENSSFTVIDSKFIDIYSQDGIINIKNSCNILIKIVILLIQIHIMVVQ